jgi:hypothetical protein
MHRVSTPVALIVALTFGILFMMSMPAAIVPANRIPAAAIELSAHSSLSAGLSGLRGILPIACQKPGSRSVGPLTSHSGAAVRIEPHAALRGSHDHGGTNRP